MTPHGCLSSLLPESPGSVIKIPPFNGECRRVGQPMPMPGAATGKYQDEADG